MATIGIVVGAILGLVALGRAGWRIVGGIYRWAKRIERYTAYIDAELRHNSGDSLRDELCRQGIVIDEIRAAGLHRDERLAHLEQQVAGHVRPRVDDIHDSVVTGEQPTVQPKGHD